MYAHMLARLSIHTSQASVRGAAFVALGVAAEGNPGIQRAILDHAVLNKAIQHMGKDDVST